MSRIASPIPPITRRSVTAALAVALIAAAGLPAMAQETTTRLFKIISVKDDVVIGLNAAEMASLGGSDAPAVARALKDKGTLSAWQYASRKAANGDLEQAPLKKIGVLANDALRVEPYATPLKIVPHD